ncbi:uncharacterized protein TNCV_3431891 [Trichonephila clavipes]|nr:uncharacterized protein TNCV_3431891 [Trichonephila clavipes]
MSPPLNTNVSGHLPNLIFKPPGWASVMLQQISIIEEYGSSPGTLCLGTSHQWFFGTKVIESVEEGERKVDVAKAFEIPLSSLSTILKNKEKIFSASSSRVRKCVSKGTSPRLEQCLVSWMRQCRGQNIPMGGS